MKLDARIPSGPVQGKWDKRRFEMKLADGAVYRLFQDRATSAWFIDAIVD